MSRRRVVTALPRIDIAGVVCVRSTRAATSRVGRKVEVDDDTQGLVASEDLNPQQARVALRLALVKPRSLADIQRLFVEY
jgi:L-asparaginase